MSKEYLAKIRINRINNQRMVHLSIKKLRLLKAENAKFLRIKKENFIENV